MWKMKIRKICVRVIPNREYKSKTENQKMGQHKGHGVLWSPKWETLEKKGQLCSLELRWHLVEEMRAWHKLFVNTFDWLS